MNQPNEPDAYGTGGHEPRPATHAVVDGLLREPPSSQRALIDAMKPDDVRELLLAALRIIELVETSHMEMAMDEQSDAALSALLSRIAELEADAARLDWLEQNAEDVQYRPQTVGARDMGRVWTVIDREGRYWYGRTIAEAVAHARGVRRIDDPPYLGPFEGAPYMRSQGRDGKLLEGDKGL